jgi:hypothetical protein
MQERLLTRKYRKLRRMYEKEERDILELVSEFFKGDIQKIYLWYRTENPHLGGFSPMMMILAGGQERLLSWVKYQIESNKPPEEHPFTKEDFEKLKGLEPKAPDLPDPADDDL